MSFKFFLSKCSNVIFLVLIITVAKNHSLSAPKELPGTEILSWNGDIASRLIDNCDQFLLKKIEQAVKKRNSSSAIPDREKLKNIIEFIKFLRFNDIAILRSISGNLSFASH